MQREALGKRIREARKQKSLTQQQLAEKAEMDEKHLSRIENGKFFPTHATLNKILTALNVSFDEVGYNLEFVKIKHNPMLEKALQILNTARNDKELNCYIEALKCVQKALNVKNFE